MVAEFRILERGESVNCVAALRDHLAAAEKGEIVAVAVAYVLSSGDSGSNFAQDTCAPSKVHLLGAVEVLKQRIVDYLLER